MEISSGRMSATRRRSVTTLFPHNCSSSDSTTSGLAAQKLMATGALVPDAMILRLILGELTHRAFMKAPWPRPDTLNSRSDSGGVLSGISEPVFKFNDSPEASFILDGFPRTSGQASQLDDLVPINLVVHINTPTSIILDRIANRWVHAPSGRVYNTTFNPPKDAGKDDITGEALSRREDDDPETWKNRLKKFDETSMPLLDHYDRKGVLWRVEGNSSDEISPKLFEEFGKRFGGS